LSWTVLISLFFFLVSTSYHNVGKNLFIYCNWNTWTIVLYWLFCIKKEKEKKSEAIHELKSWQEAPFLCCINSAVRLITVKLKQSFMIRELIIMIILWLGPFSTEELSLFLYTLIFWYYPSMGEGANLINLKVKPSWSQLINWGNN
jgi:hypothetical protein